MSRKISRITRMITKRTKLVEVWMKKQLMDKLKSLRWNRRIRSDIRDIRDIRERRNRRNRRT